MIDLSYKAKVRIYFPEKISLKKTITITTKQLHYLINVMRKKKNDTLLIFNSVDGEYLAKISQIYKKYVAYILHMYKIQLWNQKTINLKDLQTQEST